MLCPVATGGPDGNNAGSINQGVGMVFRKFGLALLLLAAWHNAHADAATRAKLPPIYVSTVKPGEDRMIDRLRAQHADAAYRADDESQILLRKNWAATGSFIKEDRPRALDLLAGQGA